MIMLARLDIIFDGSPPALFTIAAVVAFVLLSNELLWGNIIVEYVSGKTTFDFGVCNLAFDCSVF
jgi:hypothetical protein